MRRPFVAASLMMAGSLTRTARTIASRSSPSAPPRRRAAARRGELQCPPAAARRQQFRGVIHGARPGKTVAFVSGSHGTECASTVALTRLISRIDPARLQQVRHHRATLNVASFEQMTVHVTDRSWGRTRAIRRRHGLTDGSRAGARRRADRRTRRCHVDLHGGDIGEICVHSYWTAYRQ